MYAAVLSNESRIHVVDSHTGGEPTRVLISGGPELGRGPLENRLVRFRDCFDHYRSAICNEPRGSEAAVGALLCEPTHSSSVAGVIFFNNVGFLGMCGHGTIGLAVTLAYMGRITPGNHSIETPVGIVEVTLHDTNSATVSNVESRRTRKNVALQVPGLGAIVGDVAWGGNWFYLVYQFPLSIDPSNLDGLIDYSWRIRKALAENGITGDDGAEIDHIELYGPPTISGAHSKNFVLCPGGSYDRSPCGTGTSAKLACLYADGKLRQGEIWRQESVIGSIFEGSFRVREGRVFPSIKGSAFITAETNILIDQSDPFCWGIRR